MRLRLPSLRSAVRTTAAALAVAAVAGGAAPSDALAAKKAVLPGWSLVGDYDLQVDPGFQSVAGAYSFSLEGSAGSLEVAYDKTAKLAVGGLIDLTFLNLSGTFSVDGDGLQRVSIVDSPKKPSFAFDGVVQPDGRSIVGTYLRKEGFGGLAGTANGALTMNRLSPSTIPSTFRLIAPCTMNRAGVVSGSVGDDGKEKRAFLDVYGGRSFSGGRITGRVKTTAATESAPATTTAKLKIAGPGWSAVLDGPIDADGFHAAVDLRAAGFVITDAPALLPVQPGPEPPPPPPPPPPKNLLDKGVAKIVGGHVTVTRGSAPKKFFGAAGNVTVEFPTSAFGQTVVADPSTASLANPVRFYVKIGTKTYGTGAAGGSVSMNVRSFVQGSTQVVEMLCTGTVADGTGGVKQLFPPDGILLQAAVER